ncbi:hypothetical protein [Oceanobacillus sp. CF4.6]|uniref:hypothetical protein n=1 Tax=Oceanobacillus sp. CF4.6 TaxID=3373080 RepID=UPI003EE70542
MSVKTKVTAEQKKAIEWALKYSPMYKDNPNELLQRHGFSKYDEPGFESPLKSLNELNTLSLAKALTIGYEVEPEFKVGDWITHKLTGDIGKVTKTDPLRVDNGMGGYSGGYRYSTPEEIEQEKERRWWDKLGRKVNEFKMTDVIRVENGIGLYEVVTNYDNQRLSITHDFANTEFTIYVDEATLVVPSDKRLDMKP